jgi:hypothetical protein
MISKIDSIVKNIMSGSDIGQTELKRMITKQWALEKRVKLLEEAKQKESCNDRNYRSQLQ